MTITLQYMLDIITWWTIVEKKVRYVVDFDPEITEIITETKMMENLGFSVPEIARNVALQEDKYIQYVDGLKVMLKRYHTVLHSLDHSEVSSC